MMTIFAVLFSSLVFHGELFTTVTTQCSNTCLESPEIRALRSADVRESNMIELCETSRGSEFCTCQIDVDPDRIPKRIEKHSCDCSRYCGISRSGRCRSIHHNQIVFQRLNRCNEKGYYMYEKTIQNVSVGCEYVPSETEPADQIRTQP